MSTQPVLQHVPVPPSTVQGLAHGVPLDDDVVVVVLPAELLDEAWLVLPPLEDVPLPVLSPLEDAPLPVLPPVDALLPVLALPEAP